MQIEVIIKELLYTHDCVIVPCFGGFVSNYKTAIVKNSPIATFTPPQKFIVFNQSLILDDGLLVSSIAREYSLEYNEAKKELEVFVDSVKSRLTKGETFTISGLGNFTFNQEKNIIFEPNITENLLADSFGFEPFQYNVLKNPVLVRKEYNKFSDIDPIRKAQIIKYAKRSLALAPVIALLIYLPNTIEPSQLSSLNLFKKDKIEDVKNIEVANVAPVENEIIRAIDEKTNKEIALKYIEPNKQKISVTPLSYLIIAGSFKNEENAAKLIKKLASDNIEAQIIRNDDFLRVYIDGFSDKIMAEDKLQTLKNKKPEYAGFWIYTQIID
ncbi:MAG: SPOR domain-containing protein [Bacteroidales bacterium]|nr:SPOR domain-containing protein [Bacteroidales bacterium]